MTSRDGSNISAKPPILVTGGAGYIGTHFALELLDNGEVPIIIDDLSASSRHHLPAGVTLIVGDVADAELVKHVLREYRIQEIVHFAAKIVVPESVAHPLDYYLANTAKTCALLRSAVDAGVERVVLSSTAAVYGNARSNPVGEETPADPLSPYGTSKLMCEWMLRDASRAHGLSYAALRYFNVAGADPQGRFGQASADATHLIKVAVQAALGVRPSITVYGTDYDTPDGTCVRDYIHVSDLASAHIAVLRRLRVHGGALVLNCGYGRGFSVLDVIEAVKRVSGVDFPVLMGPRRHGDPESLVADVARIRELAPWTPKYHELDTIVSTALAWEQRMVPKPSWKQEHGRSEN